MRERTGNARARTPVSHMTPLRVTHIPVLSALLMFAVLALVLAPAVAAEPPSPGFLGAVEDMPLMPGLTEEVDAELIFDKPGGRIVETVAAGAVTSDAVRDFYLATLPQLGWRIVEGDSPGLRFRRDGETLSLEIGLAEASRIRVRFSFTPE